MPNTPKMNFPYPPYARKPYYASPPGFGIVDFFNAVDAAVYDILQSLSALDHEALAGLLGGAESDHYHLKQTEHDAVITEGSASREDRNVFFAGGGVFTFDAGTGTLSWGDALWIITGNTDDAVYVGAGSVVIPDGQYAYVTVPRPIAGGGPVTMNVGAGVGDNDTSFMICYRDGIGIYFRNGFVLLDGKSSRPFEQSDNYLWQNPVIEWANDPPGGTPSKGDRYLVGGIPTGVWVGHEDEIAEWGVNLAWIFTPPAQGMILVNEEDDGVLFYDAGWLDFRTVLEDVDTSFLNDQQWKGEVRSGVTVDVNAYGIFAALYLALDGHYETAKADSATTMPCTALALSAGTGGSKEVLRSGYVRNDSWTFANIGQAVYLDPSTAGGVTQVEPSVGGQKIQILGHAVDTHILDFNPNLAFAEV